MRIKGLEDCVAYKLKLEGSEFDIWRITNGDGGSIPGTIDIDIVREGYNGFVGQGHIDGIRDIEMYLGSGTGALKKDFVSACEHIAHIRANGLPECEVD
jgi:hypothetical protein